MSFLGLLKNGEFSENAFKIHSTIISEDGDRRASGNQPRTDERRISEEKEKKPEEILRGDGFKIKLITRTAFGIQIDFAKKYDDEDVLKTLSDYNVKIKGKSVFIVE